MTKQGEMYAQQNLGSDWVSITLDQSSLCTHWLARYPMGLQGSSNLIRLEGNPS